MSLAAALQAKRNKLAKVTTTEPASSHKKAHPITSKGIQYWFNLPEDVEKSWPSADSQQDLLKILQKSSGAKCFLIDFFAYSCTNCIRTLPVMKSLHERYHSMGLQIIGFHRPEFDFEKDPFNMRDFINRENIKYVVGLDNDDTAWNEWGVEFWPQHFLVVAEGEDFVIEYQHYGDRNHHEMEQALVHILRRLAKKDQDQDKASESHSLPDTINPYNHQTYFDAEFFTGKDHRVKNLTQKKGTGCDEGACSIADKKAAAYSGEIPGPDESIEFVEYGASWCPFCRKAKALFQQLHPDNSPNYFAYHDVDHFGGGQTVRTYLSSVHKSLDENHKTIPIIYHKGKFIGGYSELVDVLKSQGKPVEDLIEKIDENDKKNPQHQKLVFNKNSVDSTIEFIAQEWTSQNECLLSKVDGASLTISIQMETGGSDLQLYLVAAPPNDTQVIEGREEFFKMLAKDKEKITIFHNDGTLWESGQKVQVSIENGFVEKKVRVVEPVEKVVSLTNPDRHHVLTLTKDAINSQVKLIFEKDTRLYVAFFTTEPK
eukprot:TRINITY_DN6044_c0_g1_i1.p1 TRINITY_DN6044_c0_g1~~TRINITY_DN6044_c0_g1_i1.p1  ORF type:complete len:542 (-),score=124.06 TRINITY_DN6044_c0_g1_i1:67-1692(-)